METHAGRAPLESARLFENRIRENSNFIIDFFIKCLPSVRKKFNNNLVPRKTLRETLI